MANQPEKYVCAHCGYTADGKFTGDICDESLTKEGCRLIFEKKLSGSRYLDSFDELHEMQAKE
ncbi:MAG: hypothetical protein ACQET7_13250 [Thermodesulfobacteriota bacterium]